MKTELLDKVPTDLIAAACKVAGKDINRSNLPQAKAIVPIDATIRIKGILSFGNPSTARGTIPYRQVLARLLDYLAAYEPKRLESFLVQLADWGIELGAGSEQRTDKLLEPLRGEPSERSGSIGGVIGVTEMELTN